MRRRSRRRGEKEEEEYKVEYQDDQQDDHVEVPQGVLELAQALPCSSAPPPGGG